MTQKFYNVVAYDHNKNELDRIENVRAWTRREAYIEVMHELVEHNYWDAFLSTNL